MKPLAIQGVFLLAFGLIFCYNYINVYSSQQGFGNSPLYQITVNEE